MVKPHTMSNLMCQCSSHVIPCIYSSHATKTCIHNDRTIVQTTCTWEISKSLNSIATIIPLNFSYHPYIIVFIIGPSTKIFNRQFIPRTRGKNTYSILFISGNSTTINPHYTICRISIRIYRS